MKKLLAISLVAAMLLPFAGCQNDGTGNSSAPEESSNLSAAANSEESTEDNTSSLQSLSEISQPDGIFDLAAYESDAVFEIEKVDMSSELDENIGKELDKKCTTYEFWFISDGYRIKAYISIPAESIKSQKPCKCLVYCRGGNSNLGTLEPNDTAMQCAVTNRIVIACELRGCNGSEGFDQFGGDDLHDVIKLIDLCENQFSSFADMDDFCVEGMSRGGLMTYMAARQDKRIKKIIVLSGLSDLFKVFEQREDKMPEVLISCIEGTPEEKPEEYKKRSAVYWAEEIKIPVLIIHSRGDQKANFEAQANAVYNKLKETTDCKIIVHEDDLHEFHQSDMADVANWLDNN